MTFQFHWVDDDLCVVSLGDEWLADISFDTYGRRGMEETLEIIQTIADRFSVEVVES